MYLSCEGRNPGKAIHKLRTRFGFLPSQEGRPKTTEFGGLFHAIALGKGRYGVDGCNIAGYKLASGALMRKSIARSGICAYRNAQSLSI